MADSSRRRLAWLAYFWAAMLIVYLVPTPSARGGEKDCSNSYIEGFTALTDLGEGSYQGEVGGLYPGGSNVLPDEHLGLGLELAGQVMPLDIQGEPNSNGTIVMISIGVSNTSSEFIDFMEFAESDGDLNPRVAFVNGAQSGASIGAWLDPQGQTWNEVDERLAESGLTPLQVQAAWVKLPGSDPSQEFPEDASQYADNLAVVIQNLKSNYPNIHLAYLSSRIYGGYGDKLNPEPWAYQNGFGVKWTIEHQLDGGLNPDPNEGNVVAPWIGWGPYLWANGLGPDRTVGGLPGRSDGLEWRCEDFATDGIHPSQVGEEKVAQMLLDTLKADPTSCPWLVEDNDSCPLEAVPPPPPNTDPDAVFTDIADSVFEEDIEWLAEAGITKGCNPPTNDRFCPTDPVTRGEMAAFLTRALDLPAGPDAFVDDEGSVFEADINALARAGITKGCNPPTDDRFCPTDPVTRGEMAAFLHRSSSFFS